MAEKWDNQQITHVIGEAIRRALADSEFRQLLLTDQKVALARIDSRPLPPELKIAFTDTGVGQRVNESGVTVISLPASIASEELTEEELEKVAGGGQGCLVGTYTNCCITVITGCCVTVA